MKKDDPMYDPVMDYDGSQGPLFVNRDREEYDDTDETKEIELQAIESAYAAATTEARLEREAEQEEEANEPFDTNCWWCGELFRTGGDEPERFCSDACDLCWCKESQQRANEALASWWAKEKETKRTYNCAICEKEFESLPTTDGTCSHECGAEQSARMWAEDEAEAERARAWAVGD